MHAGEKGGRLVHFVQLDVPHQEVLVGHVHVVGVKLTFARGDSSAPPHATLIRDHPSAAGLQPEH